MVKYVCSITSYPNCRMHDAGYPCDELCFVSSIKEYAAKLVENMNDYSYGSLHSCKTGEVVAYNYVHLARHSAVGVDLTVRGRKFTTIDDGHGKLIWERKQ